MSKHREEEPLTLWDILVGVFAVIGFVFFIGELFGSNEDTKAIEEAPKDNELDNKRVKLAEVEAKISQLQPHKDQLNKTENRIYLWARIVIAIMFVGVNMLGLALNNWQIDLGQHLNINGAIALVYSFFAFIIYGTPDKLIRGIKLKTKKYLRRKHIHTLSELKSLVKEKKELTQQIATLEKDIQSEPKQELLMVGTSENKTNELIKLQQNQ
ncbi:MAG: hypothetical protein KDC90_07110 [Ignavibacteriae bacterium]|nr:hypothetical protein [Ignavibacteriota bacterium]